jgi:cation:H+ antiporter
MLFNLLLIAAGLAALFYGAEWLVKGAVRIAQALGVPALVIGLTLVAFGTSMPEFIVSITAALRENSDIALGNVVGSNIANIGLILGIVGLLFPIFVNSQVLRREIPQMIGVSLIAWFFAWDGEIVQWEGILLFIGVIVFTAYSYYTSRQATKNDAELATIAEIEEFIEAEGDAPAKVNFVLETGRAVLGIAVLMLGAQWLVEGATFIARSFGISELVIGLTLVAIGTSLPELATSLVSAFRKEDDISVGNIVGSNIFNLLAVLGGASVIRPVTVDMVSRNVDFPVMIGFAVVLIPLFWSGKLARWHGALLLLAYIVYCAYLFTR